MNENSLMRLGIIHPEHRLVIIIFTQVMFIPFFLLQTIYLEGDRQAEAADLYPLPAGPGAETGLQCRDGAILRGERGGAYQNILQVRDTGWGQVRR